MNQSNIKSVRSIAIASGKGGVGKTSFAVNLAVRLSESHRVLLIDADMGLANTHILLDMELPVIDWTKINTSYNSFEDIVRKTSLGFDLAVGANGNSLLASLGYEDTVALIRKFDIFSSRYDFVVIDCAAGISENVLAFLNSADIRIIVANNEPASTTDCYGLIKALGKTNNLENLYLLCNRMERNTAQNYYNGMMNATQRFLNVFLQYAGSLVDDPYMSTCWKRGVPIVLLKPKCLVSLQISEIADNLSRLEIHADISGLSKIARTPDEP